MNIFYVQWRLFGRLISWCDLARVDHIGLAATEGLAISPEVGVGTKGEDLSWVDGTFGIVCAGRASLKWVSNSTAATSMGTSGAV